MERSPPESIGELSVRQRNSLVGVNEVVDNLSGGPLP